MRTIKIVLSLARAATRLSATTRRAAAVLALAMFSGLAINAEDLQQGFYLEGTMNGWTMNSNYLLTKNPSNGDEFLIHDVVLKNGDELKVYNTYDNKNLWIPSGDNAKFYGENGVYTVIFRENYHNDWNGHFWFTKTGTINVTPSVNMATEGYGTYYNGNYDVWLPAGMKARTVTARSGNTLTYNTIADGDTDSKTVPAGTAVMLQIEPNTTPENLTLRKKLNNSTSIGENYLHGSDADGMIPSKANTKFYMLSYDSNNANIGWYYGAQDGAPFTSAANKAWLELSDNALARSFFDLPDFNEKTGINATKVEKNDNWYSIDGRRLNGKPSQRGVYINNGKKLIIK